MTKKERQAPAMIPDGRKIIAHDNLTPQIGAETTQQPIGWHGNFYRPGKGGWKTNSQGAERLAKATRLLPIGRTLRYRRRFADFARIPINNSWLEFRTSGFADPKLYVVQTNPGFIGRCLLMATDPGDLVLDPTCGSGTTAYVAEQWGRRWIAIDTSRVALALARAWIMGARYPYYLLRDTEEGVRKEADLRRVPPSEEALASVTRAGHQPDLRHGFVCERVSHITLKSIANNAEIDVIWDGFQEKLEPLRERLNQTLGENWEEWEIPRDAGEDWPTEAVDVHAKWWDARIARQKEIDDSIAAKAEHEYLYDKLYTDPSKIRVAGPFTVESLSPHRTLTVDQDDNLIDEFQAAEGDRETPEEEADFATMVL